MAYAVAVWLFVAGLYGIVTSRNLFHLLGCLSLTQSGTYVLLLAIGYRSGGGPPVFTDASPDAALVDPVATSLVLTDVVVGATVMALLYAMAVQIFKRRRTLDPVALIPEE